MRLQKVKAYSKDDRVQYKYQIILPTETIDTLGWKEGSELKDTIKGKSLVIDFVAEPSPRARKVAEPKMTYEEFRDKIKNLLQYSDGMTWTEIRTKLNLDQVVPNNKWVREMEKDIGLLRLKDPRGLIWRLRHV
jgi:bifunctional DNA-binding transcriptional regulator/antitoxin component of YhaV-PrlF toxin-antitoxin module